MEETEKLFEECRVIIRAHDPELPDLYQLVHLLAGPGEAQMEAGSKMAKPQE